MTTNYGYMPTNYGYMPTNELLAAWQSSKIKVASSLYVSEKDGNVTVSYVKGDRWVDIQIDEKRARFAETEGTNSVVKFYTRQYPTEVTYESQAWIIAYVYIAVMVFSALALILHKRKMSKGLE